MVSAPSLSLVSVTARSLVMQQQISQWCYGWCYDCTVESCVCKVYSNYDHPSFGRVLPAIFDRVLFLESLFKESELPVLL